MDLSVTEVRDLLPYLTPAERAELDAILVADMARVLWRPLPGPQLMAYDPRLTSRVTEARRGR